MTAVFAREEKAPITSNRKFSLSHGEKKHNIVLEGNVKLLGFVDFESEVMCCRFDNCGKLLAVGLSNGVIKVYSTGSKTVVYSLHASGALSNLPVTCLRWKPDKVDQMYGNVLLATYASGAVRRWHVTTGKCLNTHTEEVQMLACSYNSSGSHSIVARSDGKINMFDESTGKNINLMEPSTSSVIMDGHMMRIFAVQYNPSDDNIFVSGGWDDTVQWWDTRYSKKNSIKKIVGPHICGEGLDIEPSTLNIVTASWRKDRNLQVYDFGSGNLIKDIPSDFNKSMLYCAQWKSRDAIITGGSHGNMMRFVDSISLQTIGRVLNLPGATYSVDNNRLGVHPMVAVCSKKTAFFVEDTI